MTPSIIVTAIGSFSAENVIDSLHDMGWRVIGTDIYPADWHCEAALCDDFLQAPFATDQERYIKFLLDSASRYNAEGILPLTDLEIDVIDAHRSEFENAGIKLFMQRHQVLEVARDKYELFRHFKNNSPFSVPPTLLSAEINTHENVERLLPMIAKPRGGRSSEGLEKVVSKSQLLHLLPRSEYIFQTLLEGPVFTVDYVRDCYGNDMAIARKELLRTKNGAGVTVEIDSNPIFAEMTSFVGKTLDIVGCVNMEFILSGGKYYLIDLNPRFSAGIAFSRLEGYDMVKASMLAFENKSIPSSVAVKPCIMQKRYVEVINKIL